MLIFVHDKSEDDGYSGYVISVKEIYEPYTSFLTYIVNYNGYMKAMQQDFNSYRLFGNIYKTGDEYYATNTPKYIPVKHLNIITRAIIQYQEYEDDWLTAENYKTIKNTSKEIYDFFVAHDRQITIIRDNGDYFDLYNTMGTDESTWKVPFDISIQYICESLFDVFNNFDYGGEFDIYMRTAKESEEIQHALIKSDAAKMLEQGKEPGGVPDYNAREVYKYFRKIIDQ